MQDRVYTDKMLKDKSKDDLKRLIDTVKTSELLTDREKELNIEVLELKLNGGIKSIRDRGIAADMVAGMADIDDLGGM